MDISDITNGACLKGIKEKFWSATPFPHIVIDDFFKESIAKELSEEFPAYKSDVWHKYDNALEIKKVCNNYNVFPPLTYDIFCFLNSSQFIDELKTTLDLDKLYSDCGLNGGG